MALSNKERQARYRARAKALDGSLLTRVQVYIAPGPARVLAQLARDSGKTRRAILEELLLAADPGDGHPSGRGVRL